MQREPLPEVQPKGASCPKISIVTPSYNQAEFLEATIRSVLLQGYSNLEYIVIDGGSDDESVDIIQKYDPWIDYWESNPDNGAAEAINKGLAQSSGEWFNWLNSDDFLLPGALQTLSHVASLAPEANWISGARLDVTREGAPGRSSVPWQEDPGILALGNAFFPQDATFIRTSLLDAHDLRLDESVSNVFDTDLYFRLLQHERPLLTTAVFSAMRRHEEQKTSNLERVKAEAAEKLDRTSAKTAFQQVAERMTQTRFRPLLAGLLRILVYYELWPGVKDWKACVYDPNRRTFEIVRASQAIMI
jgi:glycosyltransferase involved in cell wall biosynthesis